MAIIGIDVGSKFVGIAIGDKQTKIASPWTTIKFNVNNYVQATTLLKTKLSTGGYTVDTFVLGWPSGSQGETTKASAMVQEFAVQLTKLYPSTRIIMQNERYSTKQAKELLFEMDLKGSTRDKNVDRVSAAIILQDYFNGQN